MTYPGASTFPSSSLYPSGITGETATGTEQVEARLGRTLDASEYPRVDALWSDAVGLVLGYCRQDFTTGLPAVVAGVIAQIVARTMTVPVTAFRTDGGPISYSGGIYLSAADKQALRPYRTRGLSSVLLASERNYS